MIARVVFGLLVPLFVLCVVVQLNDPDPVGWIAIYAAAGLVCAGVAANANAKAVTVAGAVVSVVALVWGLTLVNSAISFLESNKEPVNFTMKTGDAEEEEARETGGLAIVVTAAAAAAIVSRKKL